MVMATTSTHPQQQRLKLEFLGLENWVTIVEKRAGKTKKLPFRSTRHGIYVTFL